MTRFFFCDRDLASPDEAVRGVFGRPEKGRSTDIFGAQKRTRPHRARRGGAGPYHDWIVRVRSAYGRQAAGRYWFGTVVAVAAAPEVGIATVPVTKFAFDALPQSHTTLSSAVM